MKHKTILIFMAGMIVGALTFSIFPRKSDALEPLKTTTMGDQNPATFEEHAHAWDFEHWKGYKRALHAQGFMDDMIGSPPQTMIRQNRKPNQLHSAYMDMAAYPQVSTNII